MKKFYVMAAAAMAALSMNAQLYLVGAGEGLGWEPTAPMTIEAKDGNYAFTINDLTSLKMSTVKPAEGSETAWDEFNAAALFTNVTKENLGKALDLEINGDANVTMPWKGTWSVVVSGDYKTAIFTTTTPEPTGATAVYIRGAMTPDWGALDLWKFTPEKDTPDNKVYTFVCSGDTKILAGVEFKIADADWGNINYGAAGVVTVDEESWWNYDANNSTVAEDFEGTITFTLPDEAMGDATVFFKTGATAVDAIEVAEGEAEYFNLQGVRVANPENGLYIVRKAGKVTKEVIR